MAQECVTRLPMPPEGYVPAPHRGGPGVQQPPRGGDEFASETPGGEDAAGPALA